MKFLEKFKMNETLVIYMLSLHEMLVDCWSVILPTTLSYDQKPIITQQLFLFVICYIFVYVLSD
jgi:hypothetical protein